MIFMGDTGSLALGGALGAIAVATKHEIVLGDRRRPVRAGDAVGDHPGRLVQADRQARLPHGADPPPLRAEGWQEPQVVVRFWIISVVLALVGLATLKLR